MLSVLFALTSFELQSAQMPQVTWVSGPQLSALAQLTESQTKDWMLLEDGMTERKEIGAILVKSGQKLVLIDLESTGLGLLESITQEVDSIRKEIDEKTKLSYRGSALQLNYNPRSVLAQFVRRPVESANKVVGMSNVQIIPEVKITLENDKGQSGTFSSGSSAPIDPLEVVKFSESGEPLPKLKSNSIVPVSLATTALGRFRQSADISDSTQFALKSFWTVFDSKKQTYNEAMSNFLEALYDGAFPESDFRLLQIGGKMTDLRSINGENVGLKGFTFIRKEEDSKFNSATIKSVQKRVYLSATFEMSDGRFQPLSIELLSHIP